MTTCAVWLLLVDSERQFAGLTQTQRGSCLLLRCFRDVPSRSDNKIRKTWVSAQLYIAPKFSFEPGRRYFATPLYESLTVHYEPSAFHRLLFARLLTCHAITISPRSLLDEMRARYSGCVFQEWTRLGRYPVSFSNEPRCKRSRTFVSQRTE